MLLKMIARTLLGHGCSKTLAPAPALLTAKRIQFLLPRDGDHPFESNRRKGDKNAFLPLSSVQFEEMQSHLSRSEVGYKQAKTLNKGLVVVGNRNVEYGNGNSPHDCR